MIAERLRQVRQDAGLSRRALSIRSDVNEGTIADIEERRNRQPSYEKVVKLARALNVPPEFLYPIKFEPRQVA